jgi:hypothetical protein
MLVENLQRRDISAVEEMHGYLSLANEHGWKVPQISAATGVPESTVKQRMSWAKLPDYAQDRIGDGLSIDLATKWARLPAAALDKLAKTGRIPTSHDLTAAEHTVKIERLHERTLKLLERVGHVVTTSDELASAVKMIQRVRVSDHPEDLDELTHPLTRALVRDEAAADASNGALVLDSFHVTSPEHAWGSLEADALGWPAESIVTVDYTGSSYYLGVRVRRHGLRPVTVEREPTTDYQRDYAAATARLAELEADWKADVNARYGALLDRPTSTLLGEILTNLVDNHHAVTSNQHLVRERLGLDPDGPTLLEYAHESLDKLARVAWIIPWSTYQQPEGFPDRPDHKAADFPDRDHYDDDGAYIGPQGEPTRDQFDSDEEHEAAIQVWRDAQAEQADNPNYDDDGWDDDGDDE